VEGVVLAAMFQIVKDAIGAGSRTSRKKHKGVNFARKKMVS
jgi:hypothetical protein